MTVLLLGALLFLGQLAWASLALQTSAPAGCHHQAPQPAPENNTHQCCAIGHNSAIVVQHDSGSLTNFSVIAADVQPAIVSFAEQRTAALVTSASPPGLLTLRI